MIDPLTLLSGSGIAGSLFKLAQLWMARKSANDDARDEKDRANMLIAKDQMVDYMKVIHQSKGEVHQFPHKVKLFNGLLYDKETSKIKVVRSDTGQHDRSRGVSVIIWFYCIICFLCFFDADIVVHAIDPNRVPTVTSWFFGFYSQTKMETEVLSLTLGGVGLLLLNPMSFVISSWVTGLGWRQLARR